MILDSIRKRWPWLKNLYVNGAYDLIQFINNVVFQDFVIEVVHRIDKEPGFLVVPRRCVFERTFV